MMASKKRLRHRIAELEEITAGHRKRAVDAEAIRAQYELDRDDAIRALETNRTAISTVGGIEERTNGFGRIIDQVDQAIAAGIDIEQLTDVIATGLRWTSVMLAATIDDARAGITVWRPMDGPFREFTVSTLELIARRDDGPVGDIARDALDRLVGWCAPGQSLAPPTGA